MLREIVCLLCVFITTVPVIKLFAWGIVEDITTCVCVCVFITVCLCVCLSLSWALLRRVPAVSLVENLRRKFKVVEESG